MTRFNPLDFPTIYAHTAFVTNVNAWAGHIPFAFLLVELARPSILVELGTHRGTSYFNFCEAVYLSKTNTRCFAIDTWAGDVNVGQISPRVLESLKTLHDPRYGSFSTLIQSTFDDALGQFADGSIDVLHIDGCHTYEAVRHDYETWKSKMSEAGIILFHDTYVREENFGVYRLWEELRHKFPSFEFTSSYGLGVLGYGKSLPPKFLAFLEEANRNSAAMQNHFGALGKIHLDDIKLRQLLSAFTRQLVAINECNRQAGQPIHANPDPRAALIDPVGYSQSITEKIVSLLEETTALRQRTRGSL